MCFFNLFPCEVLLLLQALRRSQFNRFKGFVAPPCSIPTSTDSAFKSISFSQLRSSSRGRNFNPPNFQPGRTWNAATCSFDFGTIFIYQTFAQREGIVNKMAISQSCTFNSLLCLGSVCGKYVPRSRLRSTFKTCTTTRAVFDPVL